MLRKSSQGENGIFAIVPARDGAGTQRKHEELKRFGIPHVIICGERVPIRCVKYRPRRGKYDAINYGMEFVPKGTKIVVLCDVDTQIKRIDRAIRHFVDPTVGLVFTRVVVSGRVGSSFNHLLDAVRQHFLTSAEGLMIFRRRLLDELTPLSPCKAEDSLLLFGAMRLRRRIVFETDCYVITSKASESSLKNEELYKRKNVCGIYQALVISHFPPTVTAFYLMLPFLSPLLLVFGNRGRFWMRGILWGLVDFLKGDRAGFWLPTYK